MNVRTVSFVLLALSACAQEAATGASGSAVEAAGAAAGDAKTAKMKPVPAIADVVALGDDGAPKVDGEHMRVPFFLPPPPPDGVAPSGDDSDMPKPCELHRASDAPAGADVPPPPMDGAPPKDAPEGAKPPADAKPGPLALQIAVFSSADSKKPDVVVQCMAKPGEDKIAVPRELLDEALKDGGSARVILAAFPPPPAPPEKAPAPPADGGSPDGASPDGPPPVVGRGVFMTVAISDTSSLDTALAHIALPKP